MPKKVGYELQFYYLLLERRVKFEYQHPFHRFSFDFAIIEPKIVLEIEGGIWNKGRHLQPMGFMRDCKKYNLATIEGWRVIRIPAPWLNTQLTTKNKGYIYKVNDLLEKLGL